MQVHVKFFAVCRDAAGMENDTLSLQGGATLVELRRILAETYPKLAPYLERIRYSVNWEYVRADAPLADGDEVALIPPVAGGNPHG